MNYLRIVLSLTLTFFMTMCDPTEPTLPANETCSDEIKNQGEAGIDCGGPCVQCFDCFSNYCEFLSGATFSGPTTSVTWSWTLVDGVPRSELDLSSIFGLMFYVQKFEFNNKGSLIFTATASGTSGDAMATEEFKGRWRFDIPSNPQNIYCEFDEDVHPDFEHKIASLSADELKVDFGDYVAILKPE